jgi:rod shape determining protein RodA
VWLKLAYPAYALSLLLLVAVDAAGMVGMGAQRWLDLGLFQIQPSEIMKIALILALARYFHGLSAEEVGRVLFVIPPVLMVLAPAALVMRQPDLGTSAMLLLGGAAMFFVAGIRLWKFALVGALGLAAMPVMWALMRDYQRNRILTFLDPERDRLGAGWNIIQSKIAIGSGGLTGKGYLEGSQTKFEFLPASHTDFIFSVIGEELGFAGTVLVLALFAFVLWRALHIAAGVTNRFYSLMAIGLVSLITFHVFVNIGMTIGVMPVTGIPLPFISYGGSALLTNCTAIGLLLHAHTYRHE